MRRALRIAGVALVGLLAYAVFLLAYLPATVAWSLGEDAVPARLYGLEGTVWTGHAQAVTLRGGRLDAVRWKVSPLPMLTGAVVARLRGELPQGSVEARVRLWLDGGVVVEVEGLRAGTTVDTLLDLVGRSVLGIKADGRVTARLNHLRIERGEPVAADGRIVWRDAAISLGGGIPMGEVVLRLRALDGEGGIRLTLSNEGGLLTLTGEGRLVENRVDAVFRLQPRNPNDPAAHRAMRLLGLADADGTVVMDVSGSLAGSDVRVIRR